MHPKSSHTKPTQEDIDKTLAEAEAIKDKPVDEVEKEKEIQAEAEKEVEKEVDIEEPVVDNEVDIDEPKEEKEEEVQDEPDYKKKFSESSRNAQKIVAKNKKINEAIDSIADMEQPTDEEMKQEFPDWEIMEDYTKELARESVMSKKFRENLARAREEGKKIEKWNEQVDEFVADPETLTKNTELEGRLDEFKVYASAEANASIPFEVLVPAFLHNSTPPKKNKGSMFPKGSAGPSDSGKQDNRLTLEEGRKLRLTDHRKWKRYLRAGRIKIDL